MGLEAFLIFISTLISMNTNNQGQSLEDIAKPTKKEVKRPAANAECGRGGWDGN